MTQCSQFTGEEQRGGETQAQRGNAAGSRLQPSEWGQGTAPSLTCVSPQAAPGEAWAFQWKQTMNPWKMAKSFTIRYEKSICCLYSFDLGVCHWRSKSIVTVVGCFNSGNEHVRSASAWLTHTLKETTRLQDASKRFSGGRTCRWGARCLTDDRNDATERMRGHNRQTYEMRNPPVAEKSGSGHTPTLPVGRKTGRRFLGATWWAYVTSRKSILDHSAIPLLPTAPDVCRNIHANFACGKNWKWPKWMVWED